MLTLTLTTLILNMGSMWIKGHVVVGGKGMTSAAYIEVGLL
jgi:hypothetical protein